MKKQDADKVRLREAMQKIEEARALLSETESSEFGGPWFEGLDDRLASVRDQIEAAL